MYVVRAVHWNVDTKRQEWYIAGVFNDWVNACIFKDAYKEHYSCNEIMISDLAVPFVPVI